jgi:hypothetical protein
MQHCHRLTRGIADEPVEVRSKEDLGLKAMKRETKDRFVVEPVDLSRSVRAIKLKEPFFRQDLLNVLKAHRRDQILRLDFA